MNHLTTTGNDKREPVTIDARTFEQLTTSASSTETALELARCTLDLFVPFAIHDLQLSFGGPQDYHIKAVQQRAEQQRDNGSGGADLIFGGRQAGREMALLCDMVAIMAFQPGGVTIFGLHFEACVPQSEVAL